jgi:hypothetical protein
MRKMTLHCCYMTRWLGLDTKTTRIVRGMRPLCSKPARFHVAVSGLSKSHLPVQETFTRLPVPPHNEILTEYKSKSIAIPATGLGGL